MGMQIGRPPFITTASIVVVVVIFVLSFSVANGEDPYRLYTWNVTYGDIYPLGVRQQGILINGQFPGPDIDSVTNDNLVINVYNSLDEPFLISWNGVQQRRNSFQDGVWGTTCPIPPGRNFTYNLQVKDQIGSFYYFPSLAFHKAAGGFGGIRILSRPLIPVPFADPAGDYTVLIGDWYQANHTDLKAHLDEGNKLPFPDGILINGRGANGTGFYVEQGKTYRLRISNVGLMNSLNFRIQGHKMVLVEVEGTHTIQSQYSSLDLHVGQSCSVLLTADQPPADYVIVVSSRFTSQILTTTAILRYSNSRGPAQLPFPGGPTIQVDWSIDQARSFRWNLTASAARPNPQGSYHYGQINITRTIKLVNSASRVGGKLRYAINGVSHVNPATPLKLAEYYGISDKLFKYNIISDDPTVATAAATETIKTEPNVVNITFRTFVEIIFENHEKSIQSWHLDGYSFFPVAIEPGRWTPEKRKNYNLLDAVSRHTIQVYPKSWAAIMLTFDNAGMWNLRSELAERRYLGQELYISVLSPEHSLRDEYNLPDTALLCGDVASLPRPPPYSA